MSKNLFPTIVWTGRIRDADNDGVFYDLECATNVSAWFNSWDEIELVCGKGESVSLEKPWSTVNMTVIKTKNPDLIGKLFNLAISSVVAGSNNIDKNVTFDSTDKVELLERSNDNNGVTSLVVKSSDLATTYTLDTDYSVAVVENRTIITRLEGGSISAGAKVNVTWSVEQNAYKELTLEKIQRAKKYFSLEVFGENEETGKMTSLYVTPVKLNAEYLLEMKDAFRDWAPTGANLVFDLVDGWKLVFKDENI